jgi:phage terminase large subunit
MIRRVGTYYYLFPTYAQGKKILWDGMDKDGFKFLSHIPENIRKRVDNQSMQIELVNGSIFQIIGTDNIDSLVGTNPVGCVFSEYPLQDPQAWGFLRPILRENGGWAVFNFTPRGRMNHGYDLYQTAKGDRENWYCEVLTVDDTKVIDPEGLEQEKREMRQQYGDDSLFLQEYYCSFDAAVQGSYYANLIRDAESGGRVTQVPYDPRLPVDTWWDLGVGDSTAIWFTQTVGSQIRVIDYYEASGEGFPFYAKVLQERGYIYGTHNGPHDLQVRELGSGVSRIETAAKLGIKFRTVQNIPIDDGINAARMILPLCWFDAEKCKQGLNALSNYHKEYDEKRKEYKNSPFHDWSSHGADAFRYFGVGHKLSDPEKRKRKQEFVSYGANYLPHVKAL